MPTEIIAETCPAPECNLAERDVEQCLEELQAYHGLFEPAFRRVEQSEGADVYLRGLLSHLPRKSIEPIALAWGVPVRPLQYFIGQSPWPTEPALAIHQRLLGETLGEADGVMLIDESGVVKQGDDSVGVAPQYCGAVGKVANCQVGVYLGYVSRKGYSLVEGRLFLPQAWFDEAHAEKRRKTGVPTDLTHQTKPALALELLQNAVRRGDFPFQWVAADALYGDSPDFRDGVAQLDKWYFVEVACSTPVGPRQPAVRLPGPAGHNRWGHLRLPAGRTARANDLVSHVPHEAWERYTIKEGSKGPIVCDFAFLRITEARQGQPGREVWLVLRRNVADPTEIKFYLSNAPARLPRTELVRLSGMRWPIESIFEEGKGEVGFDHYETRSWLGWHHHMLLVSLAHHFLVRWRVRLQGRAPALTVYQVRLLLLSVLPQPKLDITAALALIRYYQKRNYGAYASHRKATLERLAAFSNFAL